MKDTDIQQELDNSSILYGFGFMAVFSCAPAIMNYLNPSDEKIGFTVLVLFLLLPILSIFVIAQKTVKTWFYFVMLGMAAIVSGIMFVSCQYHISSFTSGSSNDIPAWISILTLLMYVMIVGITFITTRKNNMRMFSFFAFVIILLQIATGTKMIELTKFAHNYMTTGQSLGYVPSTEATHLSVLNTPGVAKNIERVGNKFDYKINASQLHHTNIGEKEIAPIGITIDDKSHTTIWSYENGKILPNLIKDSSHNDFHILAILMNINVIQSNIAQDNKK